MHKFIRFKKDALIINVFIQHHLNRKSYCNFALIITQYHLCFFIFICRDIEHY